MKTLDFILPAKNAEPASDMDSPAFRHSSAKPSEPFDKMMNRALAKPVREHGEKPSAVKKPASNPTALRKPRPSVGAESNAASNSLSTGPSDVSVRDNPSPKREEKNSSSGEAASSTSTDAGKETAKSLTTESADFDNTSTLQALASVAVDQTSIALPDVSKTAKTSAEISPIGTAATQIRPEIFSATGSANSENATVAAKTELKPDLKKPADAGKKVSAGGVDPAKISGSDEGAIPIQALLDKAEGISETPANTTNSTPGKPHALTSDATGTSTAQQTATMKNADQSAKVAGAPEQSLPGVTVVASAAQAVARARPALKVVRAESSDATASASSAAVDRPPSTGETSSSNLISASSQTELRARALDRTHDILALHGMQLKQTNTDSLHVVIKPGAGLQLSLQMKQTGDGIEAQAILQQGNFDDLNKHWAELQQRLEERGIRLAPLGNDSAAANSGSENFQRQSGQTAQQEALSAGAFAEFAASGVTTPRTTHAPAIAARGWESWA